MTELNLKTYHTKPAQVEAIQITEDNMDAVAQWCAGEVKTPKDQPKFIKVKVWRAANEKQTMGKVGDWILRRGNGFKVYNDTAFRNSYHDGEALPMLPVGGETLAVEAVFFGMMEDLKRMRQTTLRPMLRKDPVDGPVPDAHEVVFVTPPRGVLAVKDLIPGNPSMGKNLDPASPLFTAAVPTGYEKPVE